MKFESEKEMEDSLVEHLNYLKASNSCEYPFEYGRIINIERQFIISPQDRADIVVFYGDPVGPENGYYKLCIEVIELKNGALNYSDAYQVLRYKNVISQIFDGYISTRIICTGITSERWITSIFEHVPDFTVTTLNIDRNGFSFENLRYDTGCSEDVNKEKIKTVLDAKVKLDELIRREYAYVETF